MLTVLALVTGCVAAPDEVELDVDDAVAPSVYPTEAKPLPFSCEPQPPGDAQSGPRITNVRHGDVLRHNLAILTGDASSNASLKVATSSSTRAFPVVGGRFRALVPLRPGCNRIDVTAIDKDGARTTTIGLVYSPDTNSRRVRPLYIEAADSDGTFDAAPGERNDRASALSRISTAVWMLQAFTAETQYEQGFGRRTFRLELDAAGRPVVETFRSQLTLQQSRAMSPGELWGYLYGELAAVPGRDAIIDLGMVQMTHYDANTGQIQAHVALGGGRLALFGSGTLHTFAEDLDGVNAAFNDTRLMPSNMFDDSAGRHTYWANYTTGAGALLHELGHTLTLPHCVYGIMGRGFDNLNRKLVIGEPELAPIPPSAEIGWDRAASVRLAFHRFLELDERVYSSNEPPRITRDADDVFVDSVSGLRAVQYEVEGAVVGHDEWLGAPLLRFKVTLADLHTRFPTATRMWIGATDDAGNIGYAELVF